MFSAPTFHPLSIAEIEEAATLFKDDLTRECKRLIRRGDHAAALSAIHAEEYIDKFVWALRTHAGSKLCEAAKAARNGASPAKEAPREIPLRARRIRLPGQSTVPALKPPVRIKLTKAEREQQRYAREVSAAARCQGHPKHY